MSENLKIWDSLKSVPAAAKKKIGGGRLKGMTDIKPQWRLQIMTEHFGPVGIGWYYETVDRWKESGADEISVYVSIKLYIKDGDKWSAPIPGIGGSMLIAKESRGLHHSDEAYKMATTDALSVAMKQLGVAADVYMGLSDSKYDKAPEQPPKPTGKPITTIQKSTLKDQIVRLEAIGSESANKAVTAINTALGAPNFFHDDAVHLINKCKLTIEKGSK